MVGIVETPIEFASIHARAAASDGSPAERRGLERAQLAALYDRLGRGFETMAVDGPRIVAERVGGRFGDGGPPPGLLGLAGGFERIDGSGDADRIQRFDGFAQEIGVEDRFLLGRVAGPDGVEASLLAIDLEAAEGSLAAVARLAVMGAGGAGTLILAAMSGLISVPFGTPEGERYISEHSEKEVGAVLSRRFAIDQSGCALNFGYDLDVPALQGALGDEYDYDAAEGEEARRRACNLQLALVVLGYDVGAIDGIVGEKTTAAWRRFRLDRGLHTTRHDGAARGRLAAAFAEKIMMLRRYG